MKYIVIVTQKHLSLPQSIKLDNDTIICFRSALSGLKSMLPDVLILGNDITSEQRLVALSKLQINPHCIVIHNDQSRDF